MSPPSYGYLLGFEFSTNPYIPHLANRKYFRKLDGFRSGLTKISMAMANDGISPLGIRNAQGNTKTQDIRTLRELTGAGINKCSKEYEKSGRRLEVALKNLLEELSNHRKVDLSQPLNSTTSGLVEYASLKHGQVGLIVQDGIGLMLELRCKTSFVANSQNFLDLLQNILENIFEIVLKSPKVDFPQIQIESIIETCVIEGLSIKEVLLDAQQKFGEAIKLSGNSFFSIGNQYETDHSHIGYYLHNRVRNMIGKIGVITLLKLNKKPSGLLEQNLIEDFSEKISMHIAAANPIYNNIEDVCPQLIQTKRKEILSDLRHSGKNEETLERIVFGKLKKYYQEIVLNEQEWFLDDSKTRVSGIIAKYSTKIKNNLKISKFSKFSITG